MRLLRSLLLLPFALAAAATSHAHDTWFEPLPSARKGETAFALGTGNRFPVFELGVDTQFFASSGCRSGARTVDLDFVRHTDKQTLLRTPLADPALTCWLQLDPFEFELPADKIEVYFKEIRPNAAVLAAWAGLKARGLPFIERYTKSARWDGGSAPATPNGTAMDVLREAPAGPLAVGAEATFQVLREGRPLADFSVELINERAAIGLWHRTDADGRLRAKLPLPGRWLLRGTDLRLSPSDATKWESQFITYAFAVER
jgi:hypothetical protein